MANFKDILEGVEGDSRRLLRIFSSAKYRWHLKFAGSWCPLVGAGEGALPAADCSLCQVQVQAWWCLVVSTVVCLVWCGHYWHCSLICYHHYHQHWPVSGCGCLGWLSPVTVRRCGLQRSSGSSCIVVVVVVVWIVNVVVCCVLCVDGTWSPCLQPRPQSGTGGRGAVKGNPSQLEPECHLKLVLVVAGLAVVW